MTCSGRAMPSLVNTHSFAVGDAATLHGFGGRAEVVGGNDRITAENGSAAQLAGDVLSQFQNSSVVGGDDLINGSERGEAITGDVFNVFTALNATVRGGGDTLNGRGGNDIISGDVHGSTDGVTIAGGDDTIHGGDGADSIFGEVASGYGDGGLYQGAYPSRKSLKRIKTRIGELLGPQNVAPWLEVRDALNRILSGWRAYFSYGSCDRAYAALERHVSVRVRGFLARRHKQAGRGTVRFAWNDIYGKLGVLRLRQMPAKPPP